MHSPEDNSPNSTDSESSPPPEEITTTSLAASHSHAAAQMMDFAASVQRTFQGSKRRLPGGPSFAQSSSRDNKSRRKGDHGPRGAGTSRGDTVAWADAAIEKREKAREERDLVDTGLVEQLRKEIGDPFLERDPKGKP